MYKKPIYWVSWHSNPYNDYLFNELSKVYDLNVYYLKNKLKSHPWNSKSTKIILYKIFYLNNFKTIFALFRPQIKNNIKIIAGWNSTLTIFILIYYSLFNIEFILWTDTPNIYKIRNGLKTYLRNIYLNIIFNKAKYILVTGNIGVKLLSKYYPKYFNKIINFPFATDTNFFKPVFDEFKIKEDNCIIFLSSGRLVNSHKGFDISINAFALLKRNFPQYNFKYFIAGTGPDKSIIENLIIDNNLSNNIFLINWIEQDNLPTFYQKGDIFIHPSHFDPFPNVVLEAMACGLPVIGSNSAGSVIDRVIDNYNGYIFNDNDLFDLYDKLIKIYINKQFIKNFKINARITSEKWDINFNFTQIKNITK